MLLLLMDLIKHRSMNKILFSLRLFTINLTGGILLLFFLCLGSQNLDKRHKVNLLFNETVALPNGFIVGIAFVLGFVGGGGTAISNIKN